MHVFLNSEMNEKRLIRRRFVFFSAIFFLTSIATWFMADLFWRDGITRVQVVLLGLFVIMFGHITAGFCSAIFGFYVINRGGDSSRITKTLPKPEQMRFAPTAIIIPVFNEDVSRVFEGIRVIIESVKTTGRMEHFDFFILSDSNKPNQWIQEEVAWIELCKQVGGLGNVFYRKRRQAINKKAGNVADFLRRWGKRYRYMVVLDADSVMTGDALIKLVAMMEENPRVGIIQTAPRLIYGESLYARMQAFANRLYSPVFLAGMNYWQQHDGNYWGHNAIIRVQPFMEHCALPGLPGVEPFGGKILSHDFVEAALMRKAGWAVWLAHDMEGSYEECPPTLIDSAKRDRRWCQGNMQHTWLLTARGFRPASRFHLFMGVLGYVSSPLWMLFLLLGMVNAWNEVQLDNVGIFRMPDTTSFFGYHIQVPEALTLFVFTLVLLFTPKIVSAAVVMGDLAEVEKYGGRSKLILSTLLEVFISILLAPINMVFNSRFVVFTLLGQGVSWATQNRQANEDGTDWREAIITHGTQVVLGVIWGVGAYLVLPSYFWWLSPVIAGLVCSIPLSIFLSKAAVGRAARESGLFLTPEETAPPVELTALSNHILECYHHIPAFEPLRGDYGLMQAVLDPYINAMHIALLRQRKPSVESREWFSQLRIRLLRDGPNDFSIKEKMAILLDADSLIWLHRELWSHPAEGLSPWWKLALRQYNVLTASPTTALYR